MEIFDNFVEEDISHLLHQLLFYCTWEYCRSKITGFESDSLYDYQLVHKFFSSTNEGYSHYYNVIRPIVNTINDRLQTSCFRRIKANLQLAQLERIRSEYHWDYTNFNGEPGRNMMVGIYYVNTNDGYTEFRDGTIVESVANRFVLFPNELDHRSVSQLDVKERVVINFNMYMP